MNEEGDSYWDNDDSDENSKLKDEKNLSSLAEVKRVFEI